MTKHLYSPVSLLMRFSFLKTAILMLLFLTSLAAQAQSGWELINPAIYNYWRSVTYGNGLFVAVSSTGTNNRVMTSPDGTTWTARTSAANNAWTSVTYGNGLFVAVSNYATSNGVMTILMASLGLPELQRLIMAGVV